MSDRKKGVLDLVGCLKNDPHLILESQIEPDWWSPRFIMFALGKLVEDVSRFYEEKIFFWAASNVALREANDSKSGLASPNFFLPDLAKFPKYFFC